MSDTAHLTEASAARVAASSDGGSSPRAYETLYRGFIIHFDPPPIPVRCCDYQFWHEEYDGPEDNRCGSAATLDDAKLEIDMILEDWS